MYLRSTDACTFEVTVQCQADLGMSSHEVGNVMFQIQQQKSDVLSRQIRAHFHTGELNLTYMSMYVCTCTVSLIFLPKTCSPMQKPLCI